MKVVIDKSLCNGVGICESICCQLFSSDEDSEKIHKEIVTEDYELACRKAAKYCPAGAISIER